jgi:Histidine kinase-, DNA gyrase B-, and HSP90-like ATPase
VSTLVDTLTEQKSERPQKNDRNRDRRERTVAFGFGVEHRNQGAALDSLHRARLHRRNIAPAMMTAFTSPTMEGRCHDETRCNYPIVYRLIRSSGRIDQQHASAWDDDNTASYATPACDEQSQSAPDPSMVNTGPEIPSESIGDLFQPFRRLQRARSGVNGSTGLGLSIVASIALAHEASICANSNPVGGLQLRVQFQPRAHVAS